MPILKWCWKCQSDKPMAEFGPNKAKAGGLDNICRPCRFGPGWRIRLVSIKPDTLPSQRPKQPTQWDIMIDGKRVGGLTRLRYGDKCTDEAGHTVTRYGHAYSSADFAFTGKTLQSWKIFLAGIYQK